MERPIPQPQTIQRSITGEIVYLDQMRQKRQEPAPFKQLGKSAIAMYEQEAASYTNGTRPNIMDEYEKYDVIFSEAVASCAVLADYLIALNDRPDVLPYVDIVVQDSLHTVIDKLKATSLAGILADDSEQLAIDSDGSHYPILDLHKNNAQLTGVGLRAYGRSEDKYVYTNKHNEPFVYPDHTLVYPSNEKNTTRQLELSFSYADGKGCRFIESVGIYILSNGTISIGSNIWCSEYAETGYEGHHGKQLRNPSDKDIVAFAEVVAAAVGDNPISVQANIVQQLNELTNQAATPNASQAIKDLIQATWPAQANYLLHANLEKEDQTLAQQLSNSATAEEASLKVQALIKNWNKKRL